MKKEITLPDVLRRNGFTTNTHAFRYRLDEWKKDNGVSRNYSLEEIENSQIWHAAIGTLNDPFEVFAQRNRCELNEMNHEEHFKLWAKAFAKHQVPHEYWRVASEDNLRQHYVSNEFEAKAFMYSMINKNDFFSDFISDLRNITSVASFTKICDSRLMWGYYCRGQVGFCIIYNREKLLHSRIRLDEVEYSETQNKVNIFDYTYGYRTKTPKDVSILAKITKFKHLDWKHESELRSLYLLKGDEIGKGVAVKLDENCVDGVILGSNVNDGTKRKILKLSKKMGFKVFSAAVNLDEFCIQITEF